MLPALFFVLQELFVERISFYLSPSICTISSHRLQDAWKDIAKVVSECLADLEVPVNDIFVQHECQPDECHDVIIMGVRPRKCLVDQVRSFVVFSAEDA